MDSRIIPSEEPMIITSAEEISNLEVISQTGREVKADSKVDLIFVFDTTRSMSDKIHNLLETCKMFLDEAGKLDLDFQYALVSFGDISVQGGGDTIDLVVPLTNSVEKMKYGFSNIPENNGFGNWGETCLEGIQEAFKVKHREGAVKVLVLLTDEPALEYRTSVKEMMREIARREYLIFTIAIDEPYYRQMAEKNGGIWKEISKKANLDELLEAFREMAKKISKVASDVHELTGGSVPEYLRLKSGN